MKILVLGCGSIGSRHARNLAAIPGIDLWLYDPDSQRSRMLAQELTVQTVADPEAGLAMAPEAVLVCTPTNLHVPVALQVLQANAHLFIEKPISHTLDQVDILIEQAAVRQRVLLVGCNLRFHPPVLTLKHWVTSGAIGCPLTGRFYFGNYLPNWRPQQDYRQTYSAKAVQGGGMLLEGVHEIDYARWLMGEPSQVSASTGRVSQLETSSDDVAELCLRFASGALGEIHLNYLRPVRMRSCELIGDAGLAVWQATGKSPERSTLSLYHLDGTLQAEHHLEIDLNQMYQDEMRHFLACIQGQETPALDGPAAKRVLAIALTADQSARMGCVLPL